ncbi:unnamed protein product [Closterium sp. Naga37s-1]|nr:unnamed protein product [Closterium sp. Naga37s-1]
MPARPSSCFPHTHSPSLFISSRPVCPPCAVHLPPRPPCYRFCGNHIPETAALRVPCPVDASQYARLLSPSILRPSFVSSPHSPPPLTLLSPPPPPLTLLLPSIYRSFPSFTILASEVQLHVAKCPAAVQRGLTEGAAYFKGGLNARGPPLGARSSSTAQAGGHAAADSTAAHAHIAAAAAAAASAPAAPTTAAAAPGPDGQAAAASASAGKRAASSSAAAAAAAARRQMVAALGEGEWQRLLHLLGEAHAVAFGGHGGAWAGETWADETWAGETWADETWAGETWADETWAGETWADETWADETWADETWADETWAGEAWAGEAWAGEAWAAVSPAPLPSALLCAPLCPPPPPRPTAPGVCHSSHAMSVPFEPRHVKQQASILANLARVGLLRPLPRPRTVERPATQTGAQAERGAVVQGDAQGGSTAGHVRGAEQAGAGGAGQQRGGEEAKEARPHAGAAAVQHGGEEAGRQGEEKGLEVPVKEGESRGDGAVDEEGEGEGGGEGEGRVYVELGAGRGYLTHMLCSCFLARHVVLVERRAYKFKADRALRKLPGVNLMRVRVDIADLQLAALPSLEGRPLVAISKHLCGPATDLALRCCLNASQTSQPSQPGQLGHQGQPSEESHLNQGQQEPSQQGQPSQERQQGTRLAGLAIATCCHHLCDWDSYVNPAFFTRLGFAPSDFAAVAWMSSWALLGEGKGATGGGEGATGGGEGATGGGEGATGGGEGATGGGEGATGGGEGATGGGEGATGGGEGATGGGEGATGGGEGATGGGEGATGGGEGATGGGEGATGGGEGATGGGEGATGGGEGMNGESMGGGEEGQDAGEEAGGAAAASGAVPSTAAAAAAKRNGTVVGKEGVEEDQPQEAAAAAAAQAAAAAAQAAATTEAASRPWFAHLSVEHKVQVGRACKMLIDAGRLEWLQGRGLGVDASAEEKQSRRSALALIATTVAVSLSGSAQAVTGVKIEGPPPLAGGLPGTENSDQARDFEAPLSERFYIQIKTPDEALARAKEVIGVFPEVQGYISKKAWPYVRNELRSELGYLRYDLATVIASKAKAEKKALNAELKELVTTLESLDYAARVKDQEAAQKFFDATKSKVSALLAKL